MRRPYLGVAPLILAAWVTLSVAPGSAFEQAASEGSSSKTLRVFRSDEPTATRAVLPQDVVRGLGVDERTVECFLDETTGNIGFDSEWFAVYRFDLDADGRRDWLVRGVHDCLRHDGVTLWWVYRETPDGRSDVLRVAADSLEVLASRRNGFHDLRRFVRMPDGHAAALLYRYDGSGYQPWSVESGEGVAAPTAGADPPDEMRAAERRPALDPTRRRSLEALFGEWLPRSKTYGGLGSLHLAVGVFDWSGCSQAAYRVIRRDERGVLLAVGDDPGCTIDDETYNHVELLLRDDDCSLEVTLFPSAEAASGGALIAWGLLDRAACAQ